MAAIEATDLEAPERVSLVPDQGEDESDLVGAETKFTASISSRDWTVESLILQMRKNRIDLDPAFQRRNAWLDARKSKLIESILLNFPVPQIVLAEEPTLAGHFFVLDGKQRLLALRQFFVDDSDSQDAEFTPFKLSGLEILSDLNGCTAANLAANRPDLFAALENYSIRTVVLGKWNSEQLLLSLFLRLNTGSVPLSPQELRQALVPGPFMSWVDLASGDLPSLRRLLGNDGPDRRMIDAELTLRHLAFATSPVAYKGNLKSFLDDTSRSFNKTWEDTRAAEQQAFAEYDSAIEAAESLFTGAHVCRKWTISRFERALNRAVFDVQIFSLSHQRVRTAALGKGEAILAEFKRACDNDQAFSRSISTTTKTADAFVTRHTRWREIIRTTCNVDYDLPSPLIKAK